jgi:alpha 1,3-glucosidase
VAGGVLYVDDGETFDNQNGAYIHRSFMFNGKALKCGNLHVDPSKAAAYEQTMKDVRVEKVLLVGVSDGWLDKKTAKVTVGDKTWEVEVSVTKGQAGKANVAVVRDPKAPIIQDWRIEF